MKKIKILSKINKKIAKMNDDYLISEAKKQFSLFEEITEGIGDSGAPDFKYYAFDWDDNLLEMPTEIILKSETDEEVGMSTADFAEYREKIAKEPFSYKGKTIAGYADNPFRFFRYPTGDKQFLKDTLKAPVAPAWPDFVKCINGGSIFAIITARGHHPETLKAGVKLLIDAGYKGISKKALVASLDQYRDLAAMSEYDDDNSKIEEYLDLCKFHPVSFGAGSAANPEEAKVKALGGFIQYVRDLNQGEDVKVGFSDDDAANIEAMEKHFGNEPSLSIIYTGPEKEEVKEQTEPYQKEVAKKHSKMKIRLIGVGGRSKSAPPGAGGA
jgi:hypothetical protein